MVRVTLVIHPREEEWATLTSLSFVVSRAHSSHSLDSPCWHSLAYIQPSRYPPSYIKEGSSLETTKSYCQLQWKGERGLVHGITTKGALDDHDDDDGWKKIMNMWFRIETSSTKRTIRSNKNGYHCRDYDQWWRMDRILRDSWKGFNWACGVGC